MFWEEKIANLKKVTDPADFKVPFTDWAEVLKKIEDKFVLKENGNYSFSNWEGRIKGQKHIKRIGSANITGELEGLNPSQNYWVILSKNNSGLKNLVYDCKPTAIKTLIGLWEGDFYIVDKKYHWLAFFESDRSQIEIFKSGDFETPFDQ